MRDRQAQGRNPAASERRAFDGRSVRCRPVISEPEHHIGRDAVGNKDSVAGAVIMGDKLIERYLNSFQRKQPGRLASMPLPSSDLQRLSEQIQSTGKPPPDPPPPINFRLPPGKLPAPDDWILSTRPLAREGRVRTSVRLLRRHGQEGVRRNSRVHR